MPLFRKSKDKERKEYIDFLQKLSSTCDLSLKYAEKTEHHLRVQVLCDDVRYFIPFETEEIKRIDSKINKVLDDLKILLYTNREPYRVQSKLDDLELLIKERSSRE